MTKFILLFNFQFEKTLLLLDDVCLFIALRRVFFCSVVHIGSHFAQSADNAFQHALSTILLHGQISNSDFPGSFADNEPNVLNIKIK